MRILAIETATAAGSVALLEGSRVVAERTEHVPQRHLEWVAPVIADLLARAGWSPVQVEAVAVSTGPGSFTSLRIGMATALTWSRAHNRPIVGIPTLAVVAASAGALGAIVPLLDVRRGEVAAAVFRRDGGLTRVHADTVGGVEHVLGQLPGDRPITFTGDALVRYQDAVVRLRPDAVLAPRDRWVPTAAALGGLAWERLRNGERDDPYTVRPIYARAVT